MHSLLQNYCQPILVALRHLESRKSVFVLLHVEPTFTQHRHYVSHRVPATVLATLTGVVSQQRNSLMLTGSRPPPGIALQNMVNQAHSAASSIAHIVKIIFV
jgi:hypothetical protein